LPALCIVIGLVGAGLMVVVGLPALRVRGLTLAVTTLGLAVVADDWLFNTSWFGSSVGLRVTPPRLGAHLGTPTNTRAIYYVGLVVLTLAVFAAAALRRSGAGRLIVAVRDNEQASSAFGIYPASVKLSILAVSGFIAGVAGVLWADIPPQYVTPADFPASLSIAVIALPVIGGLGSLGGAVAAAVLLYGATFFLSPHLTSVLGNFSGGLALSLIIAGAGMAVALIKMPTGIAGAAQQSWETFLEKRAERPVTTRATTTEAKDSLPLDVREVSVRFGGVVALDGVDIVVRPGEIVGLIGTNGAGKTTLMNVISGLIKPQAGSVRLFGHEVSDLSPDYRAAYGAARSFQDASLFAGLTVMETIQVAMARTNKVGALSAMVAAPWARANERATRRAAAEIVERFGLRRWADTRTCDLSTGTRRICDLAAQVAAGPKLILLDEPTAGVAQREAEAFGPLMRRVRDELDCAVLIVEHDMPLLMGLCDRVYAMETGRVIAEGTPEAIRHDPQVVASYLGTNEAAIVRSGSTGASAAPAMNGKAKQSGRSRTQPSTRRTS
jgi:ABC-type branched-subunit amino acid transport system ATPase component/ABC-type branched-subunit amino acid transport system permease subunit